MIHTIHYLRKTLINQESNRNGNSENEYSVLGPKRTGINYFLLNYAELNRNGNSKINTI